MTKHLHMSILFFFISFSNIYSQKTDDQINKEYQRIENSKTLTIDSLTLIRGVDFNQGSTVDEKKYKIFKEKKKIVKMEYEEINKNGQRSWNKKTTVYLKNNIPFFISKNINGTVIFYLLEGGEESEPHNEKEEIYIYDWNNEKFKRFFNGHEAFPQMKICKICYEELIEEIKLEFTSKQ